MQAHLLCAHEGRNLVALDNLHGAGGQAIIHRIENDQRIGLLQERQQVKPLRATVEQPDIRRKAITFRQNFDAAHAEPFICPQDIANTKDQD